MPEDTDNNQPQSTHPHQRNVHGHETHWTALLLLVLGALLIIVVILLAAADQTTQPTKTPPTADTQVDQQSHGSVIPVENVQARDESGLSGFPDGLSVPDDAEMVRNFSADLTDTTSQRVIIFDTTMTTSDIVGQYQQWLSQNSYDVTTESDSNANGDAVSIRSQKDSKRLIFSIGNQNENERRVQVNYLTEK